MSQSLAQEVADFGIHVTLIEPGGFSTDWAGPSSKHTTQLSAYDELREKNEKWRAERMAKPGDPQASARAIMKVIDAPEPPLRVFFGDGPLQLAKADYDGRLANWEKWQPVASEAQG